MDMDRSILELVLRLGPSPSIVPLRFATRQIVQLLVLAQALPPQ
jgi:hypothetical protein